jgi:uncharacterized protein (UPF0261 family)
MLFDTLTAMFRETDTHHLVCTPYHINDPKFAELVADRVLALTTSLRGS